MLKKAAYIICIILLLAFICMCFYFAFSINDLSIKLGFGGYILAAASIVLFFTSESRSSSENNQLKNEIKTELDSINNKIGQINSRLKR